MPISADMEEDMNTSHLSFLLLPMGSCTLLAQSSSFEALQIEHVKSHPKSDP